jgi:hypothetical protein
MMPNANKIVLSRKLREKMRAWQFFLLSLYEYSETNTSIASSYSDTIQPHTTQKTQKNKNVNDDEAMTCNGVHYFVSLSLPPGNIT